MVSPIKLIQKKNKIHSVILEQEEISANKLSFKNQDRQGH